MESNNTTSFLHDGSIGDVWASLPAIKEYYRKTNKKAVLYLTNGQVAIYYEGAKHPTKDSEGRQVMLNEKMINMMIPLLKAQYYIADAKIHEGEKIDIDLNIIRQTFINMPYGDIRRWYFYIYPDLSCDLSKQYIEVPDSKLCLTKGKLLVARTERYNNININYSFLKKYENDIMFTGTVFEYDRFCKDFDLKILKFNVDNFLELAQGLKQSVGLLSNQTMVFQLAEAMKIPRIVELCHFAPNVIPIGENAYDFYAQTAVEYYVEVLLNKKPTN